jgi:hypothetical protein
MLFNLETEAICFSEVSRCLRTTRHYRSEDRTFNAVLTSWRCSNALRDYRRAQYESSSSWKPPGSTNINYSWPNREYNFHLPCLHCNLVLNRGDERSTNIQCVSPDRTSIWVDSRGLWRWCITLRITEFLDFVHRLIF